MLRVVLDTSVIVAAARSRAGASFKLLQLLSERRFAAAGSTTLLLEYEEVLTGDARPAGWSEADVAAFVDSMASLSEYHEIADRVRPLLRDPDDDFVIELALAAVVDYIVTHNVRDFGGSDSAGVRVVTPGEFLRILKDPS